MKKGINFNDFKELATERLILRKLKSEDENEIFILRSDDLINKYIARVRLKTLEEAQQFIIRINNDIMKNKVLYWAITLKNNYKLIGTICLWNFTKDRKTAELGYELFPHFHGYGIMDEATKKVIEFAFQTIDIDTMEAYTHKDNLKSISLLLRNNFLQDVKRSDEENENNTIFILRK